jgi:hypothetical protein
MKYTILLWALLSAMMLRGQENSGLSRFAFGPNIGTGAAFQSCCGDSWGYHTFGATGEYRLARFFSIEADLRYTALESDLSGWSYGSTGYSFDGFQQLRGVALTVGPRLNLRLRKGKEIGATLRAGPMLGRTTQDITNNGLPFQTRRYQPNLLLAYALDLRWAWWITDRIAVEWTTGYSAIDDFRQNLELKSFTGSPFPADITSEFPSNFIKQISERPSPVGAINLGMGLRFRL